MFSKGYFAHPSEQNRLLTKPSIFNPNIQPPFFYVYLQAIPKATQK